MKSALLAALALTAATAFAQTTTVPGTANLWLADAPAGTATIPVSGETDYAPGQSPALVSGIASGAQYSFLVTGSVNNTGGSSGLTPDGGSPIAHSSGTENNISGLTAPINSLVGVFVGSSIPAFSGVALDFSPANALNFSSLAPTLGQSFFIGDGRTTASLIQTFLAPAGATRLFLGSMDAYGWANNSGSFSVTISAIPEPSTYAAIFGVMALGVAVFRHRKS